MSLSHLDMYSFGLIFFFGLTIILGTLGNYYELLGFLAISHTFGHFTQWAVSRVSSNLTVNLHLCSVVRHPSPLGLVGHHTRSQVQS